MSEVTNEQIQNIVSDANAVVMNDLVGENEAETETSSVSTSSSGAFVPVSRPAVAPKMSKREKHNFDFMQRTKDLPTSIRSQVNRKVNLGWQTKKTRNSKGR